MTEGQSLSPEDRAFRQLLVDIIPSLRAFARGLCGSRDLADDLAQEALAKAWAARASFTAGTNFKAWIFRILRNHFYTTANVARRFVLMDPQATADLVTVQPVQGSERAIRDIMAGLATLPPPQREALMLLESGLQWDEIAMIAGCGRPRTSVTSWSPFTVTSARFWYQIARGFFRKASLSLPVSLSNVHLTSCAVNGFPSCHLTPC